MTGGKRTQDTKACLLSRKCKQSTTGNLCTDENGWKLGTYYLGDFKFAIESQCVYLFVLLHSAANTSKGVLF